MNKITSIFEENSMDSVNKEKQDRKLINVLWLANFPLLKNHKGHPASWMTSLLKEIKEDVNLTVLTWNNNIDQDTIVNDNGVKYIYIKAPSGALDLITLNQLRIRKLKSYLKNKAKEFDIIHIHGSENQYLVSCAKLEIPKVLSIQGIISEYYKVIPDRLTYRRAAWLLAGYYEKKYSKFINDYMCRTHWDTNWVKINNPRAKVHTVWEMIRGDFFENDFDFSNNSNILFTGGDKDIKGFNEMLKSFNTIKKDYPNIKLVVIGRYTKKKNYLENIIKSENLKNINVTDVEFRGMQDPQGIINAYKDCFCLVHPSYIDNSPNSVCEAQIAGLPVIASNVGGVSSLINHNKTGILTSLEPIEIAKAIESLYKDKHLQKIISSNAKEVARKRHNPLLIKNDLLKVYHNLAKTVLNEKKYDIASINL